MILGIHERLRKEYEVVKQPFIRTHSGINFTIFDPKPEMIIIDDVAHALSRLCRYGGHSNEFYSVARHSIICSYLVEPEFALEALLHDATEAFIGDCVTPLKREMPQFNKIEDAIYLVVSKKYNLNDYPHIGT